MQFSLSDHDVKSHTQILKRLGILLIGLFCGSCALLHSAGAFTPSVQVAEHESDPDGSSRTVSIADVSDDSRVQAPSTDQGAADPPILAEAKTHTDTGSQTRAVVPPNASRSSQVNESNS